jgi:hypothetical protein
MFSLHIRSSSPSIPNVVNVGIAYTYGAGKSKEKYGLNNKNIFTVIYIYCYAHEVICGVGDSANAGGSVLVVTSFRPLRDPFSFCLRGFWK